MNIMKFTLADHIEGVVIQSLKRYEDERGWLSELYRTDEQDHQVALCYISWTRPDQARGPHEHFLQSDYFVFTGPGTFRLYLWDSRVESPTYLAQMRLDVGEENPTTVLVPPRVVHAYKCTSKTIGQVINLPDKLYKGVLKAREVDEIRHEEKEPSPFILD